jgi:dTDP-4-dehydrorhamnose reductase
VRILVSGIAGQVGRDLLAELAPAGDVVGLDRAAMDLASPQSIRDAVRRVSPGIIVNPAAYTAVDRAESEPELAMRVNGEAAAVLAQEARRLGAWLVHYSTDYVFDGTQPTPYREDDPTGPVSVYGRTKLAGEQAIAASGCRHLILRTSWVYSLHGRNFLLTMQRLAGERDELRVVADQVGAPTTSLAIAQATARLLARLREPADGLDGVYHMTCGGATSWFGFAQAIVERLPRTAQALGLPAPQRRPSVTAIRTEDYPTPARRPANSVLDNGKLQRTFGIRLPDWEQAFDALLDSAVARRS